MKFIVNDRKSLSFFEVSIIISIIILAMYGLTPRFWEPPGGESCKQWAAARILNKTGGFPVFSLGPAYVTYLQFFQLFDYPQSAKLEYFFTHLFAYIAIFLMLRSVLSNVLALLFGCAWIPMLAVVEPGGAVAGIGFLALYLRGQKNSIFNIGYFPLSLIAASLCHIAYFPFLIGHIAGIAIGRRQNKQPIFNFFNSIKEMRFLSCVPKAILLMLVIFIIFFQSKRWDNNHMLIDPAYVPISLKDSLSPGFFVTGNWKYVKRIVPEPLWIYQDWHFTNKKAFGGATTILQALLKKPDMVAKNIRENMVSAIQLPIEFIAGNLKSPFAALSIMLFSIGLFGMFRYFKAKGLSPLIFSVVFGTAGVIGALMLTWFNQRYNMILLPVGLLVVAHIGPALQHFVNLLLERLSGSYTVLAVKDNLNGKKGFFIFGFLVIITGIFLNERVITALFSTDGILLPSTRLKIWFFDISLIIIGMLFVLFIIYQPKPIVDMLKRFAQMSSYRAGSIVVFVSAVCVLFTTLYPYGGMAQIKAVLANKGLLSEAEPISMIAAYPDLIASLNNKTDVLALEDVWIKAFVKKVDLNKVHTVFSLPPFTDPSGKIEKMLNNLDVIWVSYDWSKRAPSFATQSFLRYELHIEPFLKKALEKGWTAQDVKGYGKIYRHHFLKNES